MERRRGVGISETWDVEWGEWKLARNGRGKVERGEEGAGGREGRSLRDPERESVYRAFREHERHRGTRREGRVVIDRPDCVAHEPLKVPYKYGPVSVRRRLSLVLV